MELVRPTLFTKSTIWIVLERNAAHSAFLDVKVFLWYPKDVRTREIGRIETGREDVGLSILLYFSLLAVSFINYTISLTLHFIFIQCTGARSKVQGVGSQGQNNTYQWAFPTWQQVCFLMLDSCVSNVNLIVMSFQGSYTWWITEFEVKWHFWDHQFSLEINQGLQNILDFWYDRDLPFITSDLIEGNEFIIMHQHKL